MKVVMPTAHRLRATWAMAELLAHAPERMDALIILDKEHMTNDTPTIAYNTDYVVKPDGMDVYGMYNMGAEWARPDKVLFVNDDMYFPPQWGVGLPDVNGFVTFDVVEPGWIPVNERNTALSFGDTVATFKEEDFCNYAANAPHTSAEGLGWYMPLLIPTELFFSLGGYRTDPPFPNSNDVSFFNLAKDRGATFIKFESPVYHFQCLSRR